MNVSEKDVKKFIYACTYTTETSLIKQTSFSTAAILLALLANILLIVSEFICEAGVDQSSHCTPVEVNGVVISEGDVAGSSTFVEMGGSAFYLLNMTFADGPLKRVPAGLPRHLTGNECLKCMDSNVKKYPDIISGCVVEAGKTYEAGELSIGVRSGSPSSGIVTDSFREEGGEKQDIKSKFGDLTRNGENYSTFLFREYPSSGMSDRKIEYFEYSHQQECEELREEAKAGKGEVIWRKTVTTVETQIISCKVNKVKMKHVLMAMFVYRTIQLENNVHPALFLAEKHRFVPISVEDVYRAVLGMKVIDDSQNKEGIYMVYTTCGVYSWLFLLPYFIILSVMLLLAVVAAARAPRETDGIPYNSRTWFRYGEMDKSEEVDKVRGWKGRLKRWREESKVTHEITMQETKEEMELRCYNL